jgi:hypothetical protein
MRYQQPRFLRIKPPSGEYSSPSSTSFGIGLSDMVWRAEALPIAGIKECTAVTPFNDMIGVHDAAAGGPRTAHTVLNPLASIAGALEHCGPPSAVFGR